MYDEKKRRWVCDANEYVHTKASIHTVTDKYTRHDVRFIYNVSTLRCCSTAALRFKQAGRVSAEEPNCVPQQRGREGS